MGRGNQMKAFKVRLKTEAYRVLEVEAYDAEEAAEKAFDLVTYEHWLAKDEMAAEVEDVERV